MDDLPTLETIQKVIAHYHDKHIDKLKLGCTLLNVANFCLSKSTDANFYRFTEGDEDLLEKVRKCCWWSIYHFYTKRSR